MDYDSIKEEYEDSSNILIRVQLEQDITRDKLADLDKEYNDTLAKLSLAVKSRQWTDSQYKEQIIK